MNDKEKEKEKDKSNNNTTTNNNKAIEEIESHILKRYDLINKQGRPFFKL